MKPIEFKEQNITIAKDQPEYIPLPSHRTPEGEVISCWGLTIKERLKVLLTGRIWISILTFNSKLQPQRLQVKNPFKKGKKYE